MGSAPAFGLKLAGGRALVVVSQHPLETLLPLPPGGLRLDELALEVPGVTFPTDLSGGAARFQHHRLVARKVVLTVAPQAWAAMLPGDVAGVALGDARLEVHGDGQLVLEARLVDGDPVPAYLVARASLVPAPPRDVELVLTHVRVVGRHGPSALAAARALLDACGPGDAPLVRRLDVVRRVLMEVLPASGWKVPDLSALRDVEVAVTTDGIRLTCSAEHLQPVRLAASAQERVVRALAASSLLAGASPGTPQVNLLDKAALHPLALGLLADGMTPEGPGGDEAVAMVMDGLRRHPDEFELHLARARLLRTDAQAWRRVAEGAMRAGDGAVAHAAALRWAYGVADRDPQGALEAVALAAEARPRSTEVALAQAHMALPAGQPALAVQAARRALEMPLEPAQERLAALWLGQGRLQLGDTSGARRAALRALRSGDTPQGLLLLAEVDAREEQHADAVRAFLRAAELGRGPVRAEALARAAQVTETGLMDASGALVLWQQALGLSDKPVWRVHAAWAAWNARDFELAAQWALGPEGQLPREPGAARVAGLALWKLHGRDADARRLLELSLGDEHAGDTLSLAQDALQDLQNRAVPPAASARSHAAADERPRTQVLSVPTDEGDVAPSPSGEQIRAVTLSLDSPVEDQAMRATQALMAPPLDEELSEENTHSLEIPTQVRPLSRHADPSALTDPRLPQVPDGGVKPLPPLPAEERSSVSQLRHDMLEAMDAEDAATLFLHAWGGAEADRGRLRSVLHAFVQAVPIRALPLAQELDRRGEMDVAHWRVLAQAAAAQGHHSTAVQAWEVVARGHGRPSLVDTEGFVRALLAVGRGDDAWAFLATESVDRDDTFVEGAAELAEELGRTDLALQMLEAAERGATPEGALRWARRARGMAVLAGEVRAAVAAARRAARLGQAEDFDYLEEALEAAADQVGLADVLWERAYLELDAPRAVRALRLEGGQTGRPVEHALAQLRRALDNGMSFTPAVVTSLRDLARRTEDPQERRELLLTAVESDQLDEPDRQALVGELETQATTDEDKAWLDRELLTRWPSYGPALARSARRISKEDPAGASRVALGLEEVLAQAGRPVGERLTWLNFAVEQGRRAGGESATVALEHFLEFVRKQGAASRASMGDRRSWVLELADRYEALGNHAEAVRALSASEALEAPPTERAALFKRVARLEEHSLGRPERAAEALSHALRAEPQDEEAARNLATLLEFLGRWEELEALLKDRAQHAEGPALVAHLITRGDVLARQLNRPAEARAVLMQAVAAAPVSEAPVRRLLELQSTRPLAERVRTLLWVSRLRGRANAVPLIMDAARLLQKARRTSLATMLWGQVTRLWPGCEEGWRALADLHRTAGNHAGTVEALARLAEYAEEEGARQEATLERAGVLAQVLERDAEAWEVLTPLLDAGAELGVKGWALVAQLAERLGHAEPLEHALQHAVDAASAQPEDAHRRVLDGAQALLRVGALEAAQAWARVATTQTPKEAASWNLLRDVAVLREDVETQAEATRALVALLAESQPHLAAEEAQHLGELLSADGQHSLAVKALARALELDPLREGLPVRLGRALLLAGDEPQAWSVLSRLRPEQAAGMGEEALARLLAQAATGAGVFESIGAWQRVTDLAPHDALAWSRLAGAAENVGAWAQAAEAWGRAADLKQGEERSRLLRRAARAAADAGQMAQAADTLEEARSLALGPPEELLRVFRWRMAAGDMSAAAAALTQADELGAQLPEEMVAEAAAALVDAGDVQLAKDLVLLCEAPQTVALARLRLELARDALGPEEAAQLMERLAEESPDAEAAHLWDGASSSWQHANNGIRALTACQRAFDLQPTQQRAETLLDLAALRQQWATLDVAAPLAGDAALARAGDRADEAGALEMLGDAFVQRWAALEPASAAALQESVRRSDAMPEETRVAAWQAAVEAADQDDTKTVVTAGTAARRLVRLFLEKDDHEAARAWSMRIRLPEAPDLLDRLAAQQALERWDEVLQTLSELAQTPGEDAVAHTRAAVEVARDRLEDPAAALPYARAWAQLEPLAREPRAAVVELLEQTGALKEAAERVADWAQHTDGVEGQALWMRAMELARDAQEGALWCRTARQVFAGRQDLAAHQALMEALSATGDAQGAAQQALAWWEQTRSTQDALDALERLIACGTPDQAAALCAQAFPEPLPEESEIRVLDILTRHGDVDALAQRLGKALAAAPGNTEVRARFLQRMPRTLAHTEDVVSVLAAQGQQTGNADALMHATLGHLAQRDRAAASRCGSMAAKAGLPAAAAVQLQTVLEIRTALARAPAAGGEDAGWLRGGALPDDPGAMEARPSWVLRRMEDAALAEDRPNLAAASVLERVHRGGALSTHQLAEKAWMADPDCRPALLALVKARPELGASAADLVVQQGPESVRVVAQGWARAAPDAHHAAQAWDRVAAACADMLDPAAEFAALRQAQKRAPNPRRGRRLLEAARASGDVEAQQEHLAGLATLEPQHATHWNAERAHLLLDQERLADAVAVLDALEAQTSAQHRLWERAYQLAVATDNRPTQLRALTSLAAQEGEGPDALALAGLLAVDGQVDTASALVAMANNPHPAWQWLALDLATGAKDADAERQALRMLLQAGSGLAARLLVNLGGGSWLEQVDTLPALLADDAIREAEHLVVGLSQDADVVDGAVVRALAEGFADHPQTTRVLLQALAAALPATEAGVRLCDWAASAADEAGFPEAAVESWRVLAGHSGPRGVRGQRMLAELARKAGLGKEEAEWLGMLLASEPADMQAHLRMAELKRVPDGWLHLLAAISCGADAEALLSRLLDEAREAGEDLWAEQATAALAPRVGQCVTRNADGLRLADAAAQGFPARALQQLAMHPPQDPVQRANVLEAALANGALAPEVAQPQLAQLWEGMPGGEARALKHAEGAARHDPTNEASARRWVSLATSHGRPEQRVEALLHLHALLMEGAEAVDLAMEAALVLEAELGQPADALVVLNRMEAQDSRMVERRLSLAREVGSLPDEARALEARLTLHADAPVEVRQQTAWEAALVWRKAGEASRAHNVLTGLAASDEAACRGLRDRLLEDGQAATALAVVRARFTAAPAEERRALTRHLLAAVDSMDPPPESDVVEATRDLAHMQVTSDPQDADALLWLARKDGAARRFEAAAHHWNRLMLLAQSQEVAEDVHHALRTEGVAVLARTGSLDDAEKLAREQLDLHPEDRGALEVVLAAARGRGDAEEVVRCLQALVHASTQAKEKAFLWREISEWYAGVLARPDLAVQTLLTAHETLALDAPEVARLAGLAAQAAQPDVERFALARLVELDPDEAPGVALRRFDLEHAAGASATELVMLLQPVLADPAQRLWAMERLVGAATDPNVAAGVLPWLQGLPAPGASSEAVRHWRVLVKVAEAAGDAGAQVNALEALTVLEAPESWQGLARALARGGRPAEAAQACVEAAQRAEDVPQRVAWLRQAVQHYESAGDAVAAENVRIQLLESDPSDVTVIDQGETRLRRQNRVTRLPELAQSVAEAQQEPQARARMFERAAFLLRDVGGDEAGAEAAFEAAVEADPFRARCLLALADLAFRRNNLEQASQWYSRVPESADAEGELGAAEVAYRRGACLEASGGDGRAALRRALSLEDDHHAARRALVDAEVRHGNPAEAVRRMVEAGDAPRPAEEPDGYADWILKQTDAMRQAGQEDEARALLEQAHVELPSHGDLMVALGEMVRMVEPTRAAALFHRAAQLAQPGVARSKLLMQEGEAWRVADRPVERAQALAAAVVERPDDLVGVRAAVQAAVDADQDAILIGVGTELHRLNVSPALPGELHAAMATALQQDRKADGGLLMFHAESAIGQEDSWAMRLKAVDAARRLKDPVALLNHVEGALALAADPRMAAPLAAEGAKTALASQQDPARAAALIRYALEMAGGDARMLERLDAIFQPGMVDPVAAETAARMVLAGTGHPSALAWVGRVAGHRGNQRLAQLCSDAQALLAGQALEMPEEMALPTEASRSVALHRDLEWLAPRGFPGRVARLLGGMAREVHTILPTSDVQTRSLTGDEARRLAPDIRLSRSLVDVTLPVVVSDEQGAALGGATTPHVVLGRDVVRASEVIRRAVLAVGFATVRWGLEPSITLRADQTVDFFRGLVTALDAPPADVTTAAREWAAELERALKGKTLELSEQERDAAIQALTEGRIATADEARELLTRVAFLATGSLAVTQHALNAMEWMLGSEAWQHSWGRNLLVWVCCGQALDARVTLGLESPPSQ